MYSQTSISYLTQILYLVIYLYFFSAKVTIYFKNDQAFVFGKLEKLAVANLGYLIPITAYGKLLNNLLAGRNGNVMVINKDL